MKTEEQLKAQIELERELSLFTGTEAYHRLSFLHPKNFVTTDGIKFLAQKAGCFWLVDEIAFAQQIPIIKNDEMLQCMQFWKLKVHDNSSAILTCSRDEGDIVYKKEISFTDFLLDDVMLYLQTDDKYSVLMLPSEY